MSQPNLAAFLFQCLILVVYIPASYIAYRTVRVPLKNERVKKALIQLGVLDARETDKIGFNQYELQHYVLPVFLACVVVLATYSATNPYPIQKGVWTGVLEQIINVFNMDDLYSREILAGRYLFWGWMGAYIYSFNLIVRRFLSYDLTPNVYIYAASRFLLAFIVGAMTGTFMGTMNTSGGMGFDSNFATISLLMFGIGFFPDQGLNFIRINVKRLLGSEAGTATEKPLSEVEGLSIWHQARLAQDGIENVQNLANADISELVASTPFTLNQIIDWVDQSILLTYATAEASSALMKVGIQGAADVVMLCEEPDMLETLHWASGIDKNVLTIINTTLRNAANIRVIIRFRMQASMDHLKREQAQEIVPIRSTQTFYLLEPEAD